MCVFSLLIYLSSYLYGGSFDTENAGASSWKTSSSVYADHAGLPMWCSFKGIKCGLDSVRLDYKRVLSISLSFNGLEGNLTSLGSLSEMTDLDVGNNKLSGSIPQSFFHMPKLQFINLNNNQLKGSIPTFTPLNSRLIGLTMNNNLLEGTIPESMSMLTGLQSLQLNDNAFVGTIPSALGEMKSLNALYLNSNSLTGTIPSILRILFKLKTLYLDSNLLTGTIPVLDQTSLRSVILSANYLTMGSLKEVPLSTFSASALAMDIVLQSNCLAFSNPSKPSQDVTATHCRGEKGPHNICCL